MADKRVFSRPPKKISDMTDEERRAYARTLVERLRPTLPPAPQGATHPSA